MAKKEKKVVKKKKVAKKAVAQKPAPKKSAKPDLEKKLDNLAAEVRKLKAQAKRRSDNWKKFAIQFIGSAAKNGKIWIALFLLASVTVSLGSGEIFDYSNTQNGTMRGNRVSQGVNSIEADTFIGTFQGGVSGTADGNVTRGVARASIDATDLASVGTNSLGITIPDNAIAWDGYVDVTTGFSGTGVASTVALELNGSADILAAVTVTNASGFNAAGIKAIVPVGTAASAVKMTADRTLNLVVGVEGMTQGVATVIIEYDLLAN